MTSSLPEQFLFGRVVWSAIAVVADGPFDVDDLPDARPVTGTVSFTPSASIFLVDGMVPVTAMASKLTYSLAEDGTLRDHDGNFGVVLLATDSPGISPVDWTWQVSYNLNDGYSRGSFSFRLPTGTTVDLTKVAPVSSSGGVPIIKGDNASVAVGTTTTLPPGSSATVVNSGTEQDGIFDFGIPKGDKGDQGVQGIAGQPVSLLTKDQLRGVAQAAGLMVREQSYKNLVKNPRGVLPDLTVREQRRNLATNPSLIRDEATWGYYAGSAPAVATREVNVGVGARGTHFYRITWSTGTSSASAGSYSRIDNVTAAASYVASMYVRSSIAQRMRLGFEWKDSNFATISGTAGVAFDAPANIWTRINATAVAPVGAVSVVLTAYGDLTGVPWPTGATLDADGLLCEIGSVVGDYFDGDTADTKTISYEWTGTPHASASVARSAYVETRRNLAPNPAANAAGGWFGNFGVGGSGTVTALTGQTAPFSGGPTTSTRVTWTTANTSHGASGSGVLHGQAAGDGQRYIEASAGPYSASMWVRCSKIQVLSAGVFCYDSSGAYLSTLYGVPTVVQAAVWTRLTMSATLPVGTVRVVLVGYAQNGAGTALWAAGDFLEGTAAQLVAGTSTGDYFNGSTVDSEPYVYEWTGTPNASPSVQRSRIPLGWTHLSSAPYSSTQAVTPDGEFAVMAPRANHIPILLNSSLHEYFTWGLTPGYRYTAMVRVFTPTGSVKTRLYMIFGTSVDCGAVKNTWEYRRFEFVATEASHWVRLQAAEAGNGPIYVQFCLIPGSYDGPFFDGETGPALWDDQTKPHDTTSTLLPHSMSYWDGTKERWIGLDAPNETVDFVATIEAAL